MRKKTSLKAKKFSFSLDFLHGINDSIIRAKQGSYKMNTEDKIYNRPAISPVRYCKSSDGVYRIVTGRDVTVITWIDLREDSDNTEFRINTYRDTNHDAFEAFYRTKAISRDTWLSVVNQIQSVL